MSARALTHDNYLRSYLRAAFLPERADRKIELAAEDEEDDDDARKWQPGGQWCSEGQALVADVLRL